MTPVLAIAIWCAVTLFAYAAARRWQARLGLRWYTLPVVSGTALIVLALTLTGTPYGEYAAATRWLRELAGPAVVALAVPLYRQMAAWRDRALAVALAVLAGCVASMGVGLVVGAWLGLPSEVAVALAPRSVTMPVAMSAAQANGGIGPLAALGVVITGVVGCTTVLPLLRRLRVDRDHVDALLLGLVAHAIGVAQARERVPQALAYAALAMTLMAVVSVVLLPWFAALAARL